MYMLDLEMESIYKLKWMARIQELHFLIGVPVHFSFLSQMEIHIG